MIVYKLITTGPTPVGNLVVGVFLFLCVCVCVRAHVHAHLCARIHTHTSIQIHISVTAGRNFLIWGMMMDYDVHFMPVVKKNDTVWYPRPTDKHVGLEKKVPLLQG